MAYNFLKDSGIGDTAGKAGYPTSVTIQPENLVIQGIQIVLSFVGVIFLLLMMYGGFIWMTARGNEANAEKAKNIITTGIIGMIIIFGAYAITYFLVEFFSGTSLK